MQESDNGSFDDPMMKKCPHYFELIPVMGDRPSVKPKALSRDDISSEEENYGGEINVDDGDKGNVYDDDDDDNNNMDDSSISVSVPWTGDQKKSSEFRFSSSGSRKKITEQFTQSSDIIAKATVSLSVAKKELVKTQGRNLNVRNPQRKGTNRTRKIANQSGDGTQPQSNASVVVMRGF